MSQVKRKVICIILAIMPAFIIAGCSDPNSSVDTVYNPGEGHPAGWVETHGSSFIVDPQQCEACHGSDEPGSSESLRLRGGISKVSCFSESFEGMACHSGGPPGHPLPYTDPAIHGPDAKADLTYCQGCHANPSDGGPGSHPRFNVAIGNLLAGCETPGCHEAKTAHPVPWSSGPIAITHPSAGNLANACVLCHGANLEGDPDGGPACSQCHVNGSPLTAHNCTSCHEKPPREMTCNEAKDVCE
jgi:hypothetical protein